jgi:5-hydroxyisourate hydrolase
VDVRDADRELGHEAEDSVAQEPGHPGPNGERPTGTPPAPAGDHALPTISTHVLDAERGQPAAGVAVTLSWFHEGRPVRLTQALTDADGRVRDLLERPLAAGDYRLEFDLVGSGDGDEADRADRFFRRLAIDLRVVDTARSYHVPLLLAPFAMTTYRGS